MALDPSIPLAVRGPQIEPIQNQLLSLTQLQAAQRGLADQQDQRTRRNALFDVLRQPGTFGADGSISRAALPQIAQADPSAVPQYAQLANQQDELHMQRAKQLVDMQTRLLGSVRDEASYQQAKQAYASMGGDVNQLPANYDPAFVQQALRSSLTAAQQFDLQYRQSMLDLQQRREGREQQRLDMERDQPRGQVVTTADGGVVLVDPRTGNAQPVTGPGGQQVQGRVPGQLTAAQRQNAQGKLQTVAVLRQQLENLKRARSGLGVGSQGIIAGRNPLSEAGSNYDAALAALQTTVRQLTRTPGEGAMSDYESRLAQSQLPNRADYGSSIDQKIQQLEDLANTIEQGYTGMVGTPAPTAGGSGAPAEPAQGGAQAMQERAIVKTGRTADGRRVVQYSDGTIEYAE